MKTTANNGKSGKLWLALLGGLVCSSVLMLTNHSHAAAASAVSQATSKNVIVLPVVEISAKRPSAEEKAQYRAELAMEALQAPHA